MLKKSLVLLFCWGFSLAALAIDQPPSTFTDPAQEALYQHLIEELRCVVCQNQSLADSNASLAQDLRNEVHGMVQQGKNSQEITDFLVQRYGDFVLYRPPLKSSTYVLWLGPALLLFIALLTLFYFIRRHTADTAHAAPLSEQERARLNTALLHENHQDKP